MKHYQMFINGEWVNAADGGTRQIIDPANGEVLATVPEATSEDVDKAVKAARYAFDHTNWGSSDNALNRARLLNALADKLRENASFFAELDTRNCGKPIAESEIDVADSANCFDYYAGLATKIMGETVAVPANMQSMVLREPVGVCAQIIPWNYPLLMATWKIAPALAAGCTVVLKPSELTPLSALELARLAQEVGIPAGVLNVITGVGETAGAALVSHPDIDKIAFTGGTDTGVKIMAAAAKGIKRVTLELGGKNPAIVFADADLNKAIEWVAFAGFANQGEVCSAGSRILVERPIYNEVIERVKKIAEGIKLGHGLERDVKMGPLVSKEQYDKVMHYIKKALEEGDRLVCGGKHPEGAEYQKGFFIEPTIFADVKPDHTLFRDEVFGPVMSFTPFDSEEEAIALANQTEYGLAAGIFTENIARAHRVMKQIRAGIVWVNCYHPTFNELPWGGFKKSGIGRELGKYGLEAYLETKQVSINLDSGKLGWYEVNA
ncbi:MAG: aldehyde dehydrogenase family protein [Chloroherpetonaceae bacterium]|nr:aldehyde dehydrogenase family protein [Chloroherpetonaceae bacterium]MCS7212199.1 aldehyde dehydrogenase family protein [Chloroherpetonaceae bacterium]MDW8018811.1 aldehyde dehydrogenase family protein [Chloroherpetonaceae bacterium]